LKDLTAAICKYSNYTAALSTPLRCTCVPVYYSYEMP
jgi:hypothetical protein